MSTKRLQEMLDESLHGPRADSVIIDLVYVTCKRCGAEREFAHDPPIRGGEQLRDFMWAMRPCACGHAHADVKCRLVQGEKAMRLMN